MKKSADGKADEVLKGIEAVLLDMDGVIWQGNGAIPGAGRALGEFVRLGKTLIFITNNSSKARETFSTKLRALFGEEAGAAAVEQFTPSHVFTSGVAAAQAVGRGNKAYVIGERGLFAELRAGGVEALGDDDGGKVLDAQAGQKPPDVDPSIRHVVVGFDGFINYYKLTYALRCLRENPGCALVACNTDRVIPAAGGVLLPGTGCVVQAVSYSAGVAPSIVCGKPEPRLWDLIVASYPGLRAETTLMIGDNLETDIQFGRGRGIRTLLVMTGFTSPETLAALAAGGPASPDYVASSLGAIF